MTREQAKSADMPNLLFHNSTLVMCIDLLEKVINHPTLDQMKINFTTKADPIPSKHNVLTLQVNDLKICKEFSC